MNRQFNYAFDRWVAGRYDQQRAHPPNVSEQIGRAVMAAAGPQARVIELGVGTGRIAHPVVAAGGRVLGLDISADMLAAAGRAAGVSKQAFLAELGGREVAQEIAAEWTVWVSPAERLEAITARTDPESWVLPPDLFEELLEQLRAFAAETWPDLEARQPVTRRFVLNITRGEWLCA